MKKSLYSMLWAALFLTTGALGLFFLIKTFLGAYPYYQLSSSARGYVEEFSVKRIGFDKYAVEAHFFYTVEGAEYEKRQTLTTPLFLNPYGAQAHIDKYWKQKQWTVWYNKNLPHKASLQRLFPFKFFFNAIALFFVFVYFWWLKKTSGSSHEVSC